jgi:hypothetical protein
MGRVPKVPEVPEGNPWDQTPEEERLNKVLAALQGEGKVKVSRRDDKGNLRYVGTLPLTDDFSEETVREAFGGGRYSLRFFLSQDNDSYATHMGMEIEGAPLARPIVPAQAPVVPGVVPGTGSVSEVAALQMQVARLAGLVEGLTASMRESGGGGGGSLSALKDVAEVVRSLMPAGGTPGAGNVFEVAREAIAFGREVGKGGGGGEGGFPWEKLVDQGVIPLVDMARKQQDAAKPAANAPAPAAPTPKGPTMPGVPPWARYVLAEQGFITQMAREGVRPETVATLLLDRWEHKMPGAEWDAFGDAVTEAGFADQALALATQYVPALAEIRPWLGQFLLSVVAEMQDGDEPDVKVPGVSDAPGEQGGGGGPSS